MPFDPDIAYQAVQARDARFDGRLYVGVTSTGVYCRPICRVRTPRRENCRYFETAAQAEAHDFRPCLKCRPEVAPGPGTAWSVMDASGTLARQAAERLDALAGETGDAGAPAIAALAARVGVTDRHLRRIFVAEHGVTPLQYLQTRRLLLAKQLLTDSRLPVTQVALASGFRSVRRFNAAFAARYRLSPSRLRRDGAPASRGTADAGRVEMRDDAEVRRGEGDLVAGLVIAVADRQDDRPLRFEELDADALRRDLGRGDERLELRAEGVHAVAGSERAGEDLELAVFLFGDGHLSLLWRSS